MVARTRLRTFGYGLGTTTRPYVRGDYLLGGFGDALPVTDCFSAYGVCPDLICGWPAGFTVFVLLPWIIVLSFRPPRP